MTWPNEVAARVRDPRSGSVIFLSHCLLNQHTRYPGGAGRAGCVSEIVDTCLAAGYGMVQLPCPEQQAWGGVTKPLLLWTLALAERFPWLFRVRRALVPLIWAYTRLRYRSLARRSAHEMKEYVRSGHRVVGIVGVDGSPSCGVHATLDPTEVVECWGRIAIRALDRDAINSGVHQAARPGRGLFVAELDRALRAERVQIPMFAHDLQAELAGHRLPVPWAGPSGPNLPGTGASD